MKKDPQTADDQVEQVVQELHVCNYSFIATSEGSTVPDKAHEEDDLITELKNNKRQKNDTRDQRLHLVKCAKCLSRKQECLHGTIYMKRCQIFTDLIVKMTCVCIYDQMAEERLTVILAALMSPQLLSVEV